jgi:hypothetical protein
MKRRRNTSPDDMHISVTVSPAVWEQLRHLATKQRRSLNDLLNEWIAEKLELQSKPELPSDEGKKAGEVTYRPNLRTASALCDRQS